MVRCLQLVQRTTSVKKPNQEIDIIHELTLLESVSHLRRITGFLLLAIWLAATQHCGLEAAGLLANHSEDGSVPFCCSNSGPCTQDGCTMVERGSFTPSNATVKVPTPLLNECVCLLCTHLVIPVAASEPALEFEQGVGEPLGWVPTWHFARRAAQPPRAPSLIQA